MKKLSQVDFNRKAALVSRLAETREALEAAIKDYNERAGKLFGELVETAEVKFNDVVSEANGFREDIVREIEEYRDQHQEKWQESATGCAYQEWQAKWEVELNESCISAPNDIQLDEGLDEPVADILSNLDEEVSI